MEIIFKILNASIIPFWILLAFFTSSQLTKKFLFSYAVHIVLALFYMVFIVWGMYQNYGGSGGMDSLAHLRIAFQNDFILTAAWLHYLVFDLFVGTYVAKQCLKNNTSFWIKISSLALTLFFGPIGFLLFEVLNKKTNQE